MRSLEAQIRAAVARRTRSRSLREKTTRVGRGCGCQLGRRPGLLQLLGSWARWQPPKLRRHLASTCFFSGSAVPPPNSNNWAAGRSRGDQPTACGHLLDSVISHIPAIGHSLCQATAPLSALLTTSKPKCPRCLQAPILAILRVPPHPNITFPHQARTRGAGPECHAG